MELIPLFMFAAWIVYAWRDSKREDEAIKRIVNGGKKNVSIPPMGRC